MRKSIVSIESKTNDSFGTGFVIANDENGIYIVTCQHVVDEVIIPIVESLEGKVVSNLSFIDMAVLYVYGLKLPPLSLQSEFCDNQDVEVIGFSRFRKETTQKEHIHATLYKDIIELHSTANNSFYNVRKIKADDGFSFDKGNSGSPVICKESEKVIAMISNKEGNDIAYAIDIMYLNQVWRESIPKLSQKSKIVEINGSLNKDLISFFIIFTLIFGIIYIMI